MSTHVTTPDMLTHAARESIRITPDPVTGLRPSDPLAAEIPDAVNAEPLALRILAAKVERITGRPVRLPGGVNRAARLRSELRRWALRNPEAAR